MIQSMNFPLTKACVLPWGGWEALEERLRLLGLDGVEGIADTDYYDDAFPASLLSGKLNAGGATTILCSGNPMRPERPFRIQSCCTTI